VIGWMRSIVIDHLSGEGGGLGLVWWIGMGDGVGLCRGRDVVVEREAIVCIDDLWRTCLPHLTLSNSRCALPLS
jgi:hypothetical protein